MLIKLIGAVVIIHFVSTISFAQKQQYFDLSDCFSKEKLRVINRSIKLDTVTFIQVSENNGEGIIWLPIKNFKNGTIEIEMRGKDVLQRSFIGIAFHGSNDSTYDAVYCRPFNFFAKDSVRRIHAIQYVAHPVYTWKKLREEQNAVFEKEILNPPDPNGWFTMRLVITDKIVKAFINNASLPSLTVKKLTTSQTGKIGVFVGDGSGGDFKTIKIIASK
jgi:hypothetical protein